MKIMDMKMQTQTQEFNTDLAMMQDIRQTVNIGVSQIQEYKTETSKRCEEAIEGYRMHVNELEGPQKQMQIDVKEMKR